METELRCFTFGNFMLSSIQQGIQGAHAIAEMFSKYTPDGECGTMLYEWVKNHKTIVAKNAGNAEDVRNIWDMCLMQGNEFPFSQFEESASALDESVTCVAIIVPDYIYDTGVTQFSDRSVLFSKNETTELWTARDDQTGEITEYTQFEFDLIVLLKHTHLAR